LTKFLSQTKFPQTKNAEDFDFGVLFLLKNYQRKCAKALLA
jgi:hypothetical protein